MTPDELLEGLMEVHHDLERATAAVMALIALIYAVQWIARAEVKAALAKAK
jgi:hypothetical protein